MSGRSRVEVHLSPAQLAFIIREQRNAKGDLVGLILGKEKPVVREELTDTDQPKRETKTLLLVRSFQPWDMDTLFTSFAFHINSEVIDLLTDGDLSCLIGWFSYKPNFLRLSSERTVLQRKRCMTLREKQIHERFLEFLPEDRRPHFMAALFTSRGSVAADMEDVDPTLISSSHDYTFMYAHEGNVRAMVPASLHVRTKDLMSDSGQFIAKPLPSSSLSTSSTVIKKPPPSSSSSSATNRHSSNKYYTITPTGTHTTSRELGSIMGGAESTKFESWMSGDQTSIINSITATCNKMTEKAENLSQKLVATERELNKKLDEIDVSLLNNDKISYGKSLMSDTWITSVCEEEEKSSVDEAEIETQQLIDINESSQDLFASSQSAASTSPLPPQTISYSAAVKREVTTSPPTPSSTNREVPAVASQPIKTENNNEDAVDKSNDDNRRVTRRRDRVKKEVDNSQAFIESVMKDPMGKVESGGGAHTRPMGKVESGGGAHTRTMGKVESGGGAQTRRSKHT